MDTKVAEAQDSRAVSHDDDVNIVVRPVPDHLGELAAIVSAEVHPARSPELMPELFANGSTVGVYMRGAIFSDVVHQEAMVERLIAIVKVLQVEVLEHVGLLAAQVLQHPRLLLFQGLDTRRQQPAQVEPISLGPKAVPLFQSPSWRMPMPVCFGFNGRGYSLFVPVDIGRQDTDVPAAGGKRGERAAEKTRAARMVVRLGVGGGERYEETLCVRCEKRSLFFSTGNHIWYIYSWH